MYVILHGRCLASNIVRQCMIPYSCRVSAISLDSVNPKRQQKRHFAVQELPWCKTPQSHLGSQNKTKKNNNLVAQPEGDEDDNNSIEKRLKFGIVAAMEEKTRTMGINGLLPWNLPKDRKMFVNLTKNKVLVIGKHTFHERPNQTHICHARHCIVVSKTLAIENKIDDRHPVLSDSCKNMVTFVSSFSEALHKAIELADEIQYNPNPIHDDDDNDSLDCWIAGGQRLYEEAIRHPSAFKMHLTLVQGETPNAEKHDQLHIAKFPPKYRWDQKFEENQKTDVIDDHLADRKYSYIEYTRRKIR